MPRGKSIRLRKETESMIRAGLEGPAKPVRVEPVTLPAPAREPAPAKEPVKTPEPEKVPA